jgi:hypothetical protein
VTSSVSESAGQGRPAADGRLWRMSCGDAGPLLSCNLAVRGPIVAPMWPQRPVRTQPFRSVPPQLCGSLSRVSCGEDAMSPRDAWETRAPDWVRWARSPELDDDFWGFHLPEFLRLVPAPGCLTVDVGCGEGRLGRVPAKSGHRVVGFDASLTSVRAAATHPRAIRSRSRTPSGCHFPMTWPTWPSPSCPCTTSTTCEPPSPRSPESSPRWPALRGAAASGGKRPHG